MDKKFQDNKFTHKSKIEQYYDLKGYHDRKKHDGDLKTPGGDFGQISNHCYKPELKLRQTENSKILKPNLTKEKTYKIDTAYADRDLSKRFTDRVNRNMSNTRTNLRNYSLNMLNKKEDVTKKESGLRSIINIVNQVQNVLAIKSIEASVKDENVNEKPKRKRALRTKKSEIETAVASIKVSDVQIPESYVNRFKENCFKEQNNNAKETAHVAIGDIPNLATLNLSDTPQSNVLSLSTIQKKYDLENKSLDCNNLEREPDVNKASTMENNKLKSKYTVLTDMVSCEKKKPKIQRTMKQDNIPKGTLPVKKERIGSAVSKTICVNKDTGALKPEVKDNQKKKLVIRTVCTAADDPKFYKAVSFEEHKSKPTQLQIKIPNGLQSKRSVPPKDLETEKNKTVQILNKATKSINKPFKRKKEHKRVESPSRANSNATPPTEVAKWAPQSVDPHSQPYYEAWVDTTLTAISNSTDENYKKQVIKSFMQLLEDQPTQNLTYERVSDENYTGKIKIRTKNLGTK